MAQRSRRAGERGAGPRPGARPRSGARARAVDADDAACCGLPGAPAPRFFKALCDPNRLAILGRLCIARGSLTVSEVAAGFPIDLSVVSRHLALLREAGILSAERRGKEVRYAVRFDALVAALRAFADAVEACCAPPPPRRRGPREAGGA